MEKSTDVVVQKLRSKMKIIDEIDSVREKITQRSELLEDALNELKAKKSTKKKKQIS